MVGPSGVVVRIYSRSVAKPRPHVAHDRGKSPSKKVRTARIPSASFMKTRFRYGIGVRCIVTAGQYFTIGHARVRQAGHFANSR